MTLGNLCINTCNSSNVALCLSGRRRNVNDLIISCFNTGIDAYKYFAHLMKKALTSFKNIWYSELPMMSLSLAYCLVIAPINIMLKSFKTWESSRLMLCTSSDCEITSDRINLESNDRCKRKVEWYNIWINGSSALRKVLKLSYIGITDWTDMVYSLLTGCFIPFTSLFSLLGFSSGSFSVGSSSKSKLD